MDGAPPLGLGEWSCACARTCAAGMTVEGTNPCERGRLQQRRRRQFVQRDGTVHGIQIVKELLPQGMVQLAEHEIIRLVDSDLPSALVEVHGVQIGDRRARPGRDLLWKESG